MTKNPAPVQNEEEAVEQTQPEEKTAESKRLSEILTQLKQTRVTASLNLDSWPYQSRPGMEVAKEQAKAALTPLLAEYRKEIMSNTAVVFVVGSPENCKKYEEEGEEKGVLVVNALDLYFSIASSVYVRIEQDKVLHTGAIMELESQVNQACNAFNMNGSFAKVPMTSYNVRIESPADIVPIVRDVFRNSTPGFIQPIGDVISICFAQEQLLSNCERQEYAALPVAVMVSRLTVEELPEFQKRFAPGRPFVVIDADETGSSKNKLNKASKELAKKLGL